jgi:carboxyl-terminal processing protease
MSRKFGLVAILVLLAASIMGGTLGHHVYRLAASRADAEESLNKIIENYRSAIKIVEANYAGDSSGSIPYEKAHQTAIQGMLWSLDPHSSFFSPDEFRKLREDQDSRIYGIGISIRRYRDGVYIQSLIENTPAARAGLRYGDRILEVDGKDAREWSTDQVAKNVRGERGENVRLKIERAGVSTPLYFTIIRDAVPLPSIRNSFMIEPGTGYIGLTGGFQSTTYDELRETIDSLKKQGMKQLVLDLRGNPGGLLDQAISVASTFLPRGKVVVSIRGRNKEPVIHKSNVSSPESFPLVIMINGSSASASEIVSGAIQDYGRGLIIGETSFGKGLVQRVFMLPFGHGLTLTTAKYYTPYGRLIQRDYSNGSIYDYYFAHRSQSQSASPNSSPIPTIEPTVTPTPEGPSVKTAGGRVFYGGGGIEPDVKIAPLDYSIPARTKIIEAAFFFTRQLAAGQIAGLENYKVDTPQYGRVAKPTDYPITDRVTDAFRSYIKRDSGFGLTMAQIDAEMAIVKLRIRDEIITAAFSSEGGGRVLLESDPQLLGAISNLPKAKELAEKIEASGDSSPAIF